MVSFAPVEVFGWLLINTLLVAVTAFLSTADGVVGSVLLLFPIKRGASFVVDGIHYNGSKSQLGFLSDIYVSKLNLDPIKSPDTKQLN